jgi:hypothetical protein
MAKRQATKTVKKTARPARGHDFMAVARRVVEQAIGERLDGSPLEAQTPGRAVGGRKGGAARARALSPEERAEIARLGAEARWKKGD